MEVLGAGAAGWCGTKQERKSWGCDVRGVSLLAEVATLTPAEAGGVSV